MSKKVYKENYFQHDRYARQDPKIKAMLVHFRKESELKAQAAVCIYWWIVEDMHTDDYPISKLDVFADDYRCDADFLKSILEDFELFRIEDDCYVSDRVLRNLKEQQEKSEKARNKANKRWKAKGEEQPKEELTEADEEFINNVIQIFNTEFNKTQIVSKDNREKIHRITKENNITLDVWQKVFSNAKRGWDFGDKKNVKPMLKNILEEWDSFASDDYFLAPDREAAARAKKEREEAEEKRKAEERRLQEEENAKCQAARDAVCDAASAIDYIVNYMRIPQMMVRKSSVVKDYAKEFGFTVEDVIAAMENREDIE